MTNKTGIRAAAMALYQPPFKFTAGYIFDAGGKMVADDGKDDDAQLPLIAARIRGWGRIQYLDNHTGRAAALQDEVGAIVCEALNAYWASAGADIYDDGNRISEPASSPIPNAGGRLTAMVDAAMVAMADIVPPLRRSECERLILAAFGSGVCDSVQTAKAGKPAALPEIKDMENGPQNLNLNDRAFWVLGWNECRDAVREALIQSDLRPCMSKYASLAAYDTALAAWAERQQKGSNASR